MSNFSPNSDPSGSWSYQAVTPHDSTDLVRVTRGIYVGGSGNVAAVDYNGAVVVFVGVVAGSVLPIAVSRVNATNTTASGIVALF